MRTRELLREARKLGREAGESAASWAYDGNTGDEWYARTLAGLDEGDPEVLDSFNVPNLSGEWADSPTPTSLMAELGFDESDPRAEWLTDELCTAWEDAAGQAFWWEIERVCRAHVAQIGGAL